MGGGSGGSTTTTVDPVYNAGLLELAREDQVWKREFMNMFKYGVTYDPTETVHGYYDDQGNFVEGKKPVDIMSFEEWQAKNSSGTRFGGGGRSTPYSGRPGDAPPVSERDREINRLLEEQRQQNRYDQYVQDLLGQAQPTDQITRGELMGYNADDVTSEMEYLQNVVEANQELLGLQTEVSRRRGETALGLMDKVNEGIDVGGRMDRAQASVQHGFKQAREASKMDVGSYGLDPSSGRYASQNRGLALAEASGIAGARESARRLAEEEDIQRRAAALTVTQ